MSNTSSRLRHPAVLVAVAVFLVGVGIAAYWFQPWKLVTTTTVDEPLPAAAGPVATAVPVTVASPRPPLVLAEGAFISHEHATTGTAKLIRLSDGSQVLRLENLDTSDGPKLVVLLTDAPVIGNSDGWHVFEQGRHVNLGALKGNSGSANYIVPAGIDVAGLDSVSIWCDRFDVSFGAAALAPSSR